MLTTIIELLSVPIAYLNVFGFIVGCVWLAFLGEWQLIGLGVAFLLFGGQAFSFFLIPTFPILAIALSLLARKNPFGYLFGIISVIYTNGLIVGSCVFAIFICSAYYDNHFSYVSINYIPYLLMSWGIALGPWQFLASKEPDNVHSALTLFCASVFYLLFLISIFISPLLTLLITLLFFVTLLIVLPIFQLYVERATMNFEGQAGEMFAPAKMAQLTKDEIVDWQRQELQRQEKIRASLEKYNAEIDGKYQKQSFKILILDDEQPILETYNMILDGKGYTPKLVLNNQDAIKILSNERVDLVFCDMRHPRGPGEPSDMEGGIEFAKACKKVSPSTEVVVVTAYSTDKTRATAIELGVLAYLSKPFSIDDIYELIERAKRVITEKKQRGGKRQANP